MWKYTFQATRSPNREHIRDTVRHGPLSFTLFIAPCFDARNPQYTHHLHYPAHKHKPTAIPIQLKSRIIMSPITPPHWHWSKWRVNRAMEWNLRRPCLLLRHSQMSTLDIHWRELSALEVPSSSPIPTLPGQQLSLGADLRQPTRLQLTICMILNLAQTFS